MNTIKYEENLTREDADKIKILVAHTEMFHDFEVDVAHELAIENSEKGATASEYHFIVARTGDNILGYTCFGPIGCTKNRYDLYWIVVDKETQGKGLGRALILETEKKIKAMGGVKLYAETSSQDFYQATRDFYIKVAYREEVVMKDFYDDNDHKVIYVKNL